MAETPREELARLVAIVAAVLGPGAIGAVVASSSPLVAIAAVVGALLLCIAASELL